MTFRAQQPAVSVSTCPEQNKAADDAIAIIMEEAPGDENADWYVPEALLKAAGIALANRYCFALSGDEEGGFCAFVTPIRFFEKRGCCSDQTGPIDDIMPERSAPVMESCWEFYGDSGDDNHWLVFARALQAAGFYWHPGFQDYIDATLTKQIATEITVSPAPSVPAASSKKQRLQAKRR